LTHSLIHLCHKVEPVDVSEECEEVPDVKRNDVSDRNYCCLLYTLSCVLLPSSIRLFVRLCVGSIDCLIYSLIYCFVSLGWAVWCQRRT